jgi:hypothetical protein
MRNAYTFSNSVFLLFFHLFITAALRLFTLAALTFQHSGQNLTFRHLERHQFLMSFA